MYLTLFVIALTVTNGICYIVPEDDYQRATRFVNNFISDDILDAYDENILGDHKLHTRHARQTITGGITPGNPGGVQGTVGAAGTLYNNNGHRVDGHAQVSRNWHPTGPTNVAGGLQYEGPRTSATLDVNHVRHFGTDVGANVNHNLWQQGNSRLDANANYNQHFGGPFGRSRPNYGVGLNFNHRF